MAKIRYYGIPRDAADGGRIVRYIDETRKDPEPKDLPTRVELARHSTKGFEWGKIDKSTVAARPNTQKGSAQLALAVCAHALRDDARALKVFQRFKHRVMTTWNPEQTWSITAAEVHAECDAIELAAKDNHRIVEQVSKEDRVIREPEGGPGVDPSKGGIKWDTDERGNPIVHKEDE